MNKVLIYSLAFVSSSAVSFFALQPLPETVESSVLMQRGVEQTDPMHIEKLAALDSAAHLTQITVPKAIIKPVPVAKVPVVIPATVESVKTESIKTEVAAKQPISDDGVSKELLAKFNQALLATENTVVAQPEDTESENAVAVYDLPARLLARVPHIRYSSHVYSSNSTNRSVRLNDRDLREGSWLTEDIEILEILQNEVIMRVGPQSFSLKALSDWTG